MESVLKKFEKNRVNMSKICGGNGEPIPTGRMLYGTRGNMTLSGNEYAYFDDNDCCILTFTADTGESYLLDPIC